MNIELINNINDENINQLIEFSNNRGAKFLEQWAGKSISYPLTKQAIDNIKNQFIQYFVIMNLLV